MKALPFGSQWTRFAIVLLALCLSPFPFRGVASCSDSQTSPAGGFLIDMTPLLTAKGGIRAIAPDGRALTGSIGRSPFIWSRDFGIITFNLGSERFGTGTYLSDDGHVMAGTYRSDTQKDMGRGFIWHYGGEIQYMDDLDIVKISWNGLSADGRVAVGHGFSLRKESDFLLSVRDGKESREISPDVDNYYRQPSRDGKKIVLANDDRSVVVVDLENGESRELKFGGVSPSAVNGPHNRLRAGDPQNPLRRWGNGRTVPDSLVDLQGPDSPMRLNWFVDGLSQFGPLSFDGSYALGMVDLENYDHLNPAKELFRTLTNESYMTDPGKTMRVLARLDNEGDAVVIDEGTAWPMALSDDGTIALYQRDNTVRIWNEDFYRGPRTPLSLKKLVTEYAEVGMDIAVVRKAFQGRHPDPLELKDYLAEFGLNVPSNRKIRYAVMSPDGKCFYGELSHEDGEGPFPYQHFLACLGEGMAPPRWALPEGD